MYQYLVNNINRQFSQIYIYKPRALFSNKAFISRLLNFTHDISQQFVTISDGDDANK